MSPTISLYKICSLFHPVCCSCCPCCTTKWRNKERKISVSIRAAILFNRTASYALKTGRACLLYFDVRMKHKPDQVGINFNLKHIRKHYSLSTAATLMSIFIHGYSISYVSIFISGFLSDTYAAVTMPLK